jgi:UDP-glucose 4-epimerase
MKNILITGAKGFLGRNISKYFKSIGYKTFGIGHGNLFVEECEEIGLDYWYKSDITIGAIKDIGVEFDIVIHCGGSGSVGFSVQYPYDDFKKTVDGTIEVLEYIRLYNQKAHMIYPSSPAVQGEHPDSPMKESFLGKPASPYGYHKKIVEDLCQSYSEKYTLKVSIIRLFSVYGRELKKQLLWDAYHKIKDAKESAEFWGTGNETRDFIHINDAISLMQKVINLQSNNFLIINGGSGKKTTVCAIVEKIRDLVNKKIEIKFNNKINTGNPIYYWADTQKYKSYDFKTQVDIDQGLRDFIEWIEIQNG